MKGRDDEIWQAGAHQILPKRLNVLKKLIKSAAESAVFYYLLHCVYGKSFLLALQKCELLLNTLR